MNDWKKIRRQTRKRVRSGLGHARRYAERLEEETEPQRRRLTAEARRRAPGFAAFAIATALEMLRQRQPPARRRSGFLRFAQTVALIGVAALIAAVFFKPKR